MHVSKITCRLMNDCVFHCYCYNHAGDATASCFDVSNRELAGYELSVVACYADSSTVYGDIFWLENSWFIIL